MVSDACQIKDLDHLNVSPDCTTYVSDACQIKDLDHIGTPLVRLGTGFRCLSDQRLRPQRSTVL